MPDCLYQNVGIGRGYDLLITLLSSYTSLWETLKVTKGHQMRPASPARKSFAYEGGRK